MVKREEQTIQHTCRSCNKNNPNKHTLITQTKIQLVLCFGQNSEQNTLHTNVSHAASVSRWLHMLSNH